MLEIPEKIRIANGIVFDQEDNEYNLFHPSGMFINIPNNAEIVTRASDMVSYRFVTVRIPENRIIITLYSNTLPPHITIC